MLDLAHFFCLSCHGRILYVRFVSTYNIHEKSGKVNGYAPFSGSGLTSRGNRERIYSVFLAQVIGHQQISLSYVNGNAPFSMRFQADFLLTSGWIRPLRVGGHAPFSPISPLNKLFKYNRRIIVIVMRHFQISPRKVSHS